MVARRPYATKRRGARRTGQRFVPVHDPGARFQQQLFEFLAMRRYHAARQAVAGVVGHLDRRLKIVIAPDAQQRAKDLFIRHVARRTHLNNPRRHAWGNNFLGEMNTVLYVYIPSQFIGYFMWKQHMQNDNGGESVIAKALTPKGWAILLASVGVGTFCFVQALKAAGGSSTGLDGLTTIITVAAQLLMILRYREQWLLWIVLNVLSILLWAEQPAMYLMYGAYLLNSLYGYYNWTKLVKAESH